MPIDPPATPVEAEPWPYLWASTDTISSSSSEESSIFDRPQNYNPAYKAKVSARVEDTASRWQEDPVPASSAMNSATIGPEPRRNPLSPFSRKVLPCEFAIYGSCDKSFELADADQWMNHIIFDHLDCHVPKKSACWYCDDHDFDASRDGVDKMTHFRNRLGHIRLHIRDDAYDINHGSPDYNFLAHIIELGLITKPEFEKARRRQEGPVSGVTGNHNRDWISPARQRQEDGRESLVVKSSSNEIKPRMKLDGEHGLESRSTILKNRTIHSPPSSMSTMEQGAQSNFYEEKTEESLHTQLPHTTRDISADQMAARANDLDTLHHTNISGRQEEFSEDKPSPQSPEFVVENDVSNFEFTSADTQTAGNNIRELADTGYHSGFLLTADQMARRGFIQPISYGQARVPKKELYSPQHDNEDSEIPTIEAQSYISEFAADLARTVDFVNMGTNTRGRILEILPQLLEALASRLGNNADSTTLYEVSSFVRKNRFWIRRAVQHNLPPEGTEYEDNDTMHDSALSGEFAIARYLQEPGATGYFPSGHPSGDLFTLEDNTDVRMDHHRFRDIVRKTQAYEWMIATLKREVSLRRGNPDMMNQIQKDVLGVLPESHRINHQERPRNYTLVIELDWDPILFAEQQEYSDRPRLSLQSVITLTGSSNDAQALTTRQYLVQTWPNTGSYIMDLVTDAVRDAAIPWSTCTLPDETYVIVEMNDGKFFITVTGVTDSLVEIAQQFGWLGAALRSSPYETGVATCSPVLERIEDDPKSTTQILYMTMHFRVSEPFSISDGLRAGSCWHPMFKNPILVSGYPIRARPETGLGLEMPLNMMGELSGSNFADVFDDKVFIKGFSTMLIATKQSNSLIVWHYFYNADKKRVSYLDHTQGAIENIQLSTLNESRHVVGWSADCRLLAGDSVLSGNVRGSRLPAPHAGCLLEKVNLSFSQSITGGVTIAVGVKDVPPHLVRNGYIPKLRWLSRRYVVLWDEADKRGWLLNGTSALLHLVQATLKHWSSDEFSASFLFDESMLVGTTDYNAASASRILSTPQNLGLKIYPGTVELFDEEETKQKGKEKECTSAEKKKQGYYLFQDLVEMKLTALEQIIDHQERVAGKSGINLKTRIRTHLEGWDFVEIATEEDPRPRVATLQALGYGWVDLSRSIGAVTLFGRGFGDIMQPEENGICSKWTRLPTQQYYLAVTTSDLINIMTRFGDENTEPMRLVQGLAWHSPDDVLAALDCGCRRERHMTVNFWRHRSPVQVPFPLRSRFILPLRSPRKFRECEQGAIIFGHHISWKWRWSEDGREGVEKLRSELPQSTHETLENDANDSHPEISENRTTNSLLSPSGSATPPTSDNLSIGRSDASGQVSGEGHDRARRLRREKRHITST